MTSLTARRARRPLAILAAVVLAVSVLSALQTASPASAVDGSHFDPGDIISDKNFYDSSSMSAGEVQSFIQAKGGSCQANSLPCLKDVSVSNPAQAASSYCAAMPASSGRNAGAAIVAVSQACGISPRVMLVLIEKEQSLVTRSSPSSYAYMYATGFGCPDTPAGCSDAVAGFFVQLHSAGEQFQRYRKNPGSYNFQAGRVNNIQYHPNAGCGTKPVYIENQATAGLYDYTPYTPNAAALANMYGVGDSCSSYGNRNFYRIYSDWFGDPASGSLSSAGFETGVGGWGFRGQIDRAVYSSGGHSGPAFLAVVPGASGTSVSQTVPWSTQQGQTYTASIWLRAPAGTSSGQLAVWGLGGSNENSVTSFTVGSTWTQVTTRLVVEKAGHTQIKLELYFGTPRVQLNLDDASLLPGDDEPTRAALPMNSGGFESGFGGWFNGGAGPTNKIIYSGPGAKEGNHFFATNTSVNNRSFAQDITTKVDSTTSYTASVWMRSATGTPISVTVALWGLGGTGNTNKATNYVVGKDWTQISATMPVTQSGQTKLRLEVYLRTVSATLYVDGATVIPNLLPDGSFENNATGWVPHEAGTNMAVYTAGQAGLSALDAGNVGATNVAAANGSVQVDVARNIQAGETYTTSVWVRAEKGKQARLTLALWELGAANTNASTALTVGDTWQQIQVSKRVQSSSSTTLRLQLYELTPGVTVFMDSARLY